MSKLTMKKELNLLNGPIRVNHCLFNTKSTYNSSHYSLHFRVLKATIYYFKSIFLSCIDAVSIFGNLVFPIFFSCFLFRKHFCFVQLSLTLFFYLSISRFWQLYWEICISYKLLLPSDVVYVF